MSFTWLTLCPIDPEIDIEFQRLIDQLTEIEVIGLECELDKSRETQYVTGKWFVDYFQFNGIKLRDVSLVEEDYVTKRLRQEESVCVIRIRHNPAVIRVTYSPSLLNEKPICPNCDEEIQEEPIDVISLWWGDGTREVQNKFRYKCYHCASEQKIWQLNWHRIAGFFRYAIEINDFYAYSYAPHPDLLNILSQSTNTNWDYFWGRI